jgi:DNA modification methylase
MANPIRPQRRRSSLLDTRLIYCGDNLEQLKKLPENCVDLIYIDPPFNSNRDYEVFWGETREQRAFEDRHESTQAYIEFMRPRCMELRRVLKNSGTFFYHCDRHASHYIKIMLDQIFGETNFINEIIWKRSHAHSDGKQGRKAFGVVTDSVFAYGLSGHRTWHPEYRPYDKGYIDRDYRRLDEDGRRYRLDNIQGPGGAAKGNPCYEVMGVSRYWRYSKEKMAELIEKGRIIQTRPGAVPQYKRYLDEMPGVPIQNLWDDIPIINNRSKEYIGYPTQKPLPLLERIIKTSSNENDIVLDAFCGCGTALIAAELLGRQWIGIDVSPTACRVVGSRLRKDTRLREDEQLWKANRGFIIRDLPWDIEKLRRIPPFEFESWAIIALGGIPNKAKVGDMGIDGRIFPVSALPKNPKGEAKGQMDFMDMWYPVQVKQKDKVGRPEIDQFEAVMMRNNCIKGFFVGFGYSSDAIKECNSFFKRSGKVIIPFTVQELLDEEFTKKLA